MSDTTLRIVGVDLASQPANTAAVCIERASDGTMRLAFTERVENAEIRNWLQGGVVGIDAPFGWPRPFVSQLGWWQGGALEEAPIQGLSDDPKALTELLAFRLTDRFVRQHVGLTRDRKSWPHGLSVSTNLISYTTIRLVTVLTGKAIDRSGVTGAALEVYPAAALAQWDEVNGSYKPGGKSGPARSKAERRLRDLAKWVDDQFADSCPALQRQRGFRTAMSGSDHVLDAAVAAMCTWASLTGCSHPPTPATKFQPTCKLDHAFDSTGWHGDFLERERSTRPDLGEGEFESVVQSEGWIHHPTCMPSEFLLADPWSSVAQRTGGES
jgi:hypothetical protein